MIRLLVVGGGRMGHAFLGGLLRSGWAEPGDLAVVEPVASARDELERRYPGVVVCEDGCAAEAAVLAVKPTDAQAACRTIVGSGCRRVVSIAAGITLAQLETWIGGTVVVLRAMPNTPALLGAGASALAGGPAVTESDFTWAEGVLSSLGVVARVPEYQLDAVTGLSGSGPAYVFLLAEALVEAGVHEGLEREVSRLFAVQTLLGSARLLAETGDSPEVLRAMVTSPGGTTAAALRVFEAHAFRSAVLEAVAAAADRSRELGRKS
ncbi:MAG: pyrroline-5-carboxylate reductase [Acidimicrobiales bacterium]